ncbi:glycosyltransferase family 2 protein [Aquidulcibacter sp.]|jgi:dolichol-phosphate mannosyltransferase|uniref:glycosyltransferase family 2 protein n=1 Tax=Aquidulcibacter sp. TaxID=2052990 RepID=UPI003BA3FCF7
MSMQLARPERAKLADAATPLELAVIIPTFNEAGNVVPLLDNLSTALAAHHWEAIFVDDNSPDGTADLVREIGQKDTRVRVVHRIGRRGLSSAVIEGMLATSAPILAVVDGDLQHDEMALPKMVAAIETDQADIAIGTRYAKGGSVGEWNKLRHRASQGATWLGQKILQVELSDPMSGFMAIRRETLMAALPRLSGVGFKILLDIVASLPTPPRVAEVPYVFRSRLNGESKADSMIALEYISLLLDKTIGRFIPTRLVSFLAVGGLGVVVHLSVLGTMLALGASFMNGQFAAVATAIAFNFFLNNRFTYRDRRLKGWKLVTGLLSFYLVSAVGAVANIGIGNWVHQMDSQWWLAGIAGVVVGAVWNFAASSFVTWRK